MYHRICSMLESIEKKENIRILFAVESGSRAWGFPSPDSDYDVRFVYTRQPSDYLRLEKTPDVIEWQADEVFDVVGWDLKKTQQLLHRSNPTVYEWNASPVVYRNSEEWAALQPMLRACFLKKPGMHHYLNMAKSNYREYLRTDKVRLKKYFYVIRPLLACQWIMAYGTPPPMAMSELTEACLPGYLQDEMLRLTEIKMRSPEITQGSRIQILNDYIEAAMAFVEQAIKSLPDEMAISWDTLDSVFCSMVKGDLAS